MVYKGILFEIYSEGSKKKLRTLPGQTIPVKNIRSPHFDRDSELDGQVYLANLKDPARGDFYMFENSSLRLADCRFAPDRYSDKVQDYLKRVNPSLKEDSKEYERKETTKFVAPAIPGDLQIDRSTWNLLNATIKLGKYPFLIGPKGCGKSEIARRVAEANHMEFYEFDMGQAFKPKKYFLGGLVIGESGKTEQVHSLFFKAFTSDKPTLIFLDELTRIPMAASNFLMTILSRNQSFIYDNDSATRYNKGKDVVFIAAGNVGFSYVSTNRLDSAFEDRFIKMQVDYMTKEQETSLIMKRTEGITLSDASTLANVSYSLRQAERKGTLHTSLSTRQVLDAAAYCTLGFPVADVVNKVILTNYIISDELDTARGILQAL